MVKVVINDLLYEVNDNLTILEACQGLNIKIPTLCYLKNLNNEASCRMCLVELKDNHKLVPACVTKVYENMAFYTDSPKVINARIKNLELIFKMHNKDCDNCKKNGKCELQVLFDEYGFKDKKNILTCNNFIDDSTCYLVRDNSKCILCNRCVSVCNKVSSVGVIGKNNRGINTHIGCAFDSSLEDNPCIACGQCINVCPTGALSEKEEINNVIDALNNKDLHVVAITAPSVRVSLGEEFGYEIGTNVKGKMVASLKQMGFDKVFDVNFGADLTIMEEASELIERLDGGVLPMFTSCSPAWVKYVEHFHHDFIPNLSTCKSPQQMLGAVIKTYYARKFDIDSSSIYVVSIMPCVAKKYEKRRSDEAASGYNDIDSVLTTRELAKLIKIKNIDFKSLKDEEFDNPLGNGASVIFGVTGGVMESALRTAYELITKKPLKKLVFEEVRGLDGIKEASFQLGDKALNVAVVSGISNAKRILELIKSGKVKYDFVEFMTCPSGCINGGGQSFISSSIRNSDINYLEKRKKALYDEENNIPYHKAHNNPDIIELYSSYLNYPLSKRSKHILHTSYVKRSKYKDKL